VAHGVPERLDGLAKECARPSVTVPEIITARVLVPLHARSNSVSIARSPPSHERIEDVSTSSNSAPPFKQPARLLAVGRGQLIERDIAARRGR